MPIASNTNSFFELYEPYAKSAAGVSKIFPETILSVAALESNYGKSELTTRYNNFFGIKAGTTWKGKTVFLSTSEQDRTGRNLKVNSAFRWYDSPFECFKNFIEIVSSSRYVKAGIMNATNPVQQFEALQKGGYATDINYANKLRNVLTSFAGAIKANAASKNSLDVLFVAIASLGFWMLYKKSK